MSLFLLLARVVLAAVFAVAGGAKLADRQGSRQAMSGFGMPARVAGPVAILLPLAELAVAAALLPNPSARYGAIGALFLLAAFVAGISRNLARGIETDCHCFGQIHSSKVGWPTLARNLVLAGAALFVIAAGWTDPGMSPIAWIGDLGSTAALALAGATALAVLLALGGWFALQLLRQQGRLLIRIDALEGALSQAGLQIPDQAPAPEYPAIGLPVGSEAPSFALSGLRGETLTLASLLAEEKPLLLLFTDPGCGPCNALLPDVGVWQREHTDSTIALLSTGETEENRVKTAEHGVSRVLLQSEHDVFDAYQASGTPSAVLVSAEGRIASSVRPGAEAIRALVAEAAGTAQALEVVRPRQGNGNGAARPQPDTSRVGEPAPDLELSDLDGEKVSLTAFRGADTLLLFWNPGCGFCQQMLPDLKQWDTAPPDGAPALVLISTGDAEANREMGLNAPVLLDQGFTAGSAFGAGGTPMGLLLDAEGKIASQLAAGAQAVFELGASAINASRKA